MTKWLYMTSDNECAENVWDICILDCDCDMASKYCLAKAKQYVAEYVEGTEDEICQINNGYIIQFPDHHVAFFFVEFDEALSLPVLSDSSIQEVVETAENDYARWQQERL